MSVSADKPVVASTSKGGHNVIGGLSRVFHCNHYNAYLQMVVLLTQNMGQEDPEALLTDSVTPLVRLLKQHGYSDKQCIEEFSYCGFGIHLVENTKAAIGK
ncbi:MAG: hypothetical protein SVR94_09755, partial [Pseudomonadota bacterium]|nr:hypothetical protein [Pseudomonadota bacterium]